MRQLRDLPDLVRHALVHAALDYAIVDRDHASEERSRIFPEADTPINELSFSSRPIMAFSPRGSLGPFRS